MMKKSHSIRLTILIATCLLLLFGRAEESSAYTWSEYNGHYYTLTQNFGNWSQTETEAQALGGHLVTINDAGENAWLSTTFANTYTRDGSIDLGRAAAFIGYYYDSNTSTWKWISGESPTYKNLWSGFPEGGTHAYLHVSPHPYVGTWNANPIMESNSQFNFKGIVELNSNPVPIPAAAWLLATGLIGLLGIRKKSTH
jgi:hypothetical protein